MTLQIEAQVSSFDVGFFYYHTLCSAKLLSTVCLCSLLFCSGIVFSVKVSCLDLHYFSPPDVDKIRLILAVCSQPPAFRGSCAKLP